MDIKSLSNLQKYNGVYDLYTQVIVNDKPYAVYSFQCSSRHDMRIDLVCFDIYNNLDNVDILCNVNSIINPLSIQNGYTIFFVDDKDIEDIRSSSDVLNAISSILNSANNANKGKEFKQDSNKVKDNNNKINIEKSKKLIPPHIKQNNTSNIDYSEGVIILRPNL